MVQLQKYYDDMYEFLDKSCETVKVQSTYESKNDISRKYIQYHCYDKRYHNVLKLMIKSGFRSGDIFKYVGTSIHGEVRIIDHCVYNCLHFEGPMVIKKFDVTNVFDLLESKLYERGYIKDIDLRVSEYKNYKNVGRLFEIKCFYIDGEFDDKAKDKLLKSMHDLFELFESVLE